jgi:endonuclease/exonuclease/phosphatase family metal-dependent hydrolase
MKTRYLLIAILIPLLLALTGCRPEPLTVMTWNIRYNNPGDGINAWPNRKNKVVSFIREVHPKILGMQEVLNGQLEDLAGGLPEYAWFGVGRDNGRTEGEYVPVFYQKDRFRFLTGDHFWLSDSPHTPGKLGWDAACTRMVTWLELYDNFLRDTLFVFNTHFDHMGVVAREMSADMLVHATDSLAGDHLTIITGDFNSETRDAPYKIITGDEFRDSRLVSQTDPAGPEYTFTGFDVKGKPGERIDYIYLRNAPPVENYVVRDDNDGKNYLSDHLPVIVQFR